MMKLTLEEVIAAHAAISNLLNMQFSLKDFPLELFYHLSEIEPKLRRRVEAYDRTRVALVKHLAGKSQDGQPQENVNVPEDKIDEFMEALDKILDVEVEIYCEPIPRELFSGIVQPGLTWVRLSKFIADGTGNS